MRPEFVTVLGTGSVARSVADRLADAGFTTSTPPTGGAHVLVTAFAVAEPSPHIFEETRRVLAVMAPGSWWIDMTHPPLRTDDLWVPPEDLARVTRLRVPVTDVRGVLVASPPVDLDLRSRQVCDAILRVADLVLPTQTPEFPIASLDLGLAEPPAPHTTSDPSGTSRRLPRRRAPALDSATPLTRSHPGGAAGR
ncbi:hypothetical protein [Kitasatospora cathayae]|uniref:Pyrroline-5-carboxylate reductase catalytic N-terminal domain-containing protein n=1 Tax=Kitasatospora cathayae TaxID=3004092 RepID=A0ABY7QF39_9ACTN|nr:hypothetical protein [Kitasatospora sp. HUAS 3-15]WBP91343.1 hypothetical protein O1G21_39335 [Kitasatospora sp. HUAS 3-15]